MQNTPLSITTKVVAYYSLFYVVVKVFGIIKGMWLLPNLLIVVGLLVLGAIGLKIIKQNSYTWWYAGTGVILISALRYYETDLVAYLNHTF